jgi:hypothetical protein
VYCIPLGSFHFWTAYKTSGLVSLERCLAEFVAPVGEPSSTCRRTTRRVVERDSQHDDDDDKPLRKTIRKNMTCQMPQNTT